MKIAIHQPEHLPWLGFWDKIYKCDIFVLLDNTQFRKNYFQNRNRIRTVNGWTWLTVPVFTKDKSVQLINEVEINNVTDVKWQKKHWKTIEQNYQKTPYFNKYKDIFSEFYVKNWTKLVNLNISIIYAIKEILGIKTEVVIGSSLDVTGERSDLLLDICKKLGATTYLSGRFGKDYLEIEKFKKENIKVVFQEFNHPVYNQVVKPFIPEMSIIDLIFNEGTKSLTILQGD
ncbi:MAG: WbqC family protein [bacterium]|nr:WbqC family protein [bacterium]